MTESDYLDAANLARLRCALRVLQEFCHREVYEQKGCKVAANITKAFRALDDATSEMNARVELRG